MRRCWQAMGVNLVAPGLGQFRLRRWWLGTMFLALALAGFAWAAWETCAPLVVNIRQLLAEPPSDAPLQTIHLGRVASGLLGGAAVWGLSFLDLAICAARDKTADPVKDPATTSAE